jgi:uncharacterized protein
MAMNIAKRYVPILKGIDLTSRRLPLIEVESGQPGPSIVISAAVHGNEVTGTAIVQSLIKRLRNYPLIKGKIAAFPILNPFGFEMNSRNLSYSEEDINRCFAAGNEGSMAERLASVILTSMLDFRPDYAFDLHTDSMNSIAYTLVDKPTRINDVSVFEKSMDMARALGFFWSVDTEESAGYPLENCLTGQLITRGVPAVTVELGGPMVVTENFRKMGLEALWNFLFFQGMVRPESKRQVKVNQPNAYMFRQRISTKSTGIIDYRVEAGKLVKKGQILGVVRNVFGETVEVLRCPVSGMLFSHEDQSVVFPGQDLFTLACDE